MRKANPTIAMSPAWPRTVLVLLGLGGALLSTAASAQSVADNIRPVAQVCLAGQPCVGAPARSMSNPRESASPAVATPASPAAVSAPAPEPVPEPTPEPAAAPAAASFDAAAVYQQSCFACHATGAAGAPLLGDSEAWSARLEKGMDALMNNVINGVNAMPAKGMCMDCSDDDLRAIVDYMIEQ